MDYALVVGVHYVKYQSTLIRARFFDYFEISQWTELIYYSISL